MADQRQRKRKRSLKIDRGEIFTRVRDFYNDDLINITHDRDRRIQRYAKFRMWTEGKNIPWEDSSDAPLSDMMEKSLRAQDTLHNAVMSQQPVIGATAAQKPNKDQEESVDSLIHHQVFVDQQGELMIGEMAENFINDGVVTAFIPWVKEDRKVADLKVFDPIPDQAEPRQYFLQLLTTHFPNAAYEAKKNGWDWTVTQTVEEKPKKIQVKFYTRDNGDVEMVTEETVTVFEGPKPRVCQYEEILCSSRATNLQIPGPSNPGGAPHVIMIDYPTVDEIRKLQKEGFYDLMTSKEAEDLESVAPNTIDAQEKVAKDIIAGTNDEPVKKKAESHTTLTRLRCFDRYDIDGDGLDEDVIFWVILEQKTVVKASLLTEMYPSIPPKRPFAEAPMIPIPGRRTGISLLEILEGGHDTKKALLDAGINANDLANSPFFFYRASAGTRPEIIRTYPGEGYPLADPSRDVNFPTLGNSAAQGLSLNFITMQDQMQEKVSVLGDIQFGRVPPGRSSALRTNANLSLLSAQGEARPERILRRFFICLTDMWRLIHNQNRYFLPNNKKYRLIGKLPEEKDPYQSITKKDQIDADFDFSFKANVLNTSKNALQESLQGLGGAWFNPLTIQMGIAQPDGFYRYLRDLGDSFGQDADDYLAAPNPEAGTTRIFAEEAISIILQTKTPHGRPAENGGAVEHLQKLTEFVESTEFGHLNEKGENPQQIELFGEWLNTVRNLAGQQRQQEQQAQSVGQLGEQDAGGRPTESVQGDPGNPQVSSGNEQLDETQEALNVQ